MEINTKSRVTVQNRGAVRGRRRSRCSAQLTPAA